MQTRWLPTPGAVLPRTKRLLVQFPQWFRHRFLRSGLQGIPSVTMDVRGATPRLRKAWHACLYAGVVVRVVAAGWSQSGGMGDIILCACSVCEPAAASSTKARVVSDWVHSWLSAGDAQVLFSGGGLASKGHWYPMALSSPCGRDYLPKVASWACRLGSSFCCLGGDARGRVPRVRAPAFGAH